MAGVRRRSVSVIAGQPVTRGPKVASVSDTQSEWDKALAQKGLNQSSLAAKAGVSKATVSRMYHGRGRPDAGSVRKVAKVLSDGDVDAVWKLIGTGHADYGDFPIAKIADDLVLLTPKQRQSLIAIVKAMSDPEGKGFGHAADADQKIDELARRRAETEKRKREREAVGGLKKVSRKKGDRKRDDSPETDGGDT